MEDEDDIPGKIGDLLRPGRIASVDLEAGLAEVECGEVLSPPVPWTELAGAFRTWAPPSVGEQVLLICPEADIAGAIILRGLLSNAFPAPASDENHHLHGPNGLTIKLTADGIVIAAPGGIDITGDVTITGNLAVSGDADVDGTVTGQSDVIAAGISGKGHTHPGVQSGGASTAGPQ
ncbi:phage baseplate assembly protein V [Altererythrobacter sp. CC-YST694]|uniref:phage baseplate assembly protein V n=1 Tax=Altererythrobacter sp. CC-YST694 TaxID=2755038 RepID=UPI001D018246|nr:phage baseplate assembly protein V [Altererythrobacter sp. CC-YST694]MCB5423951.1 phage baseplate assembly protein V [Altererythrobacter sp. CC-YST694]